MLLAIDVGNTNSKFVVFDGERIVQQAIGKGIENVWMQPGAESDASVEACQRAGINVLADGSCLLVVLGYHER